MAGNSTLRRTTALVLVLFVLGIALGALGASLYLRRHPRKSVTVGHYSRMSRAEIVSRLSRDLNLTPEQKSQVEAIVAAAHQRFHVLDDQVEPQYDAIRQDARRQIRLILTAEQKARFEEEVRRLDEERNKGMQQ